jgi:GxxExxY protein
MDKKEISGDVQELLAREKGLIEGELCYQIVGAAMDVHNTLGPGFLEKVYENALMVAFRQSGVAAIQQAGVEVSYRGELVGLYLADILVEHRVILELKVVEAINDIHRAQAINYLKATGLRLAIIINFAGKKLQWERIVL